MRKVENITKDEILKAYKQCSSNKEVMEYFGYKKNGCGQKFVEKIRQKAGIDQYCFFERTDREHYDASPKRCINCDAVLPYEKRFNKFCCSSCAATYNNVKRGKHTLETRVKISETLKGNTNVTEEEIKKGVEILKKEIEERRDFCVQCGRRLTGSQKTFCSHKCQNEYQYKHYIERWKKGEEDGLNGEYGISAHIRRYLFEKNNCGCEICGWGEKNEYTNTIPLEIHHKDGNYKNNKEENLQLLCPNHHSLTETVKSHNKNGRKNRKKYDDKKYHRE